MRDVYSTMYTALPTPPGPVSNVAFSSSDDALLVSTYTGHIHLYRCYTPEGTLGAKVLAELAAPSPVLSLLYPANGVTLAGLADGTVRQLDYENMKVTAPLVGTPGTSIAHGINSICAVDNLRVASTYSGTLTYFDLRKHGVVHEQNTRTKIFAMDTTAKYVAVGQAGQQVAIYDVRNLALPLLLRPSGLRYQLSALKTLPSGQGYAVSSLDGRVSMDAFEDDASASLKFAFKCHRHKNAAAQMDDVYPVTALAFHRKYNTLFTAGGDGHVCVWNWEKRKRMKQFPALTNPGMVSHMDINHDGRLLVVGTINDSVLRQQDYDSGVRADSSVHLRPLGEECKPKT